MINVNTAKKMVNVYNKNRKQMLKINDAIVNAAKNGMNKISIDYFDISDETVKLLKEEGFDCMYRIVDECSAEYVISWE